MAMLLDIKIRHKRAISKAKKQWRSVEAERVSFSFERLLGILKQMRGYTYEIMDLMFHEDGTKRFELADVLKLLACHEETHDYEAYERSFQDRLHRRPHYIAKGSVLREIISDEFHF